MKTLNLSVWAVLLFAFLLSGCKKDLPIGQDVEQVWKTGDIETREAIFFDTDYAKSLHNIPYANELHTDLLARVKMRVQGASVVNIMESVQGVLAVDTIGGLRLPCWSCGEYGMSLATHTSMLYVPILSTSGAPEVKGILLFNIYGPKTDFYFLESHKWIAAPQSHFALVANFFEQKIGGGIPPDTEPQFLTRPCEFESHIDDDDPVSDMYTCICRQADYRCSIQEQGTIYDTNPCRNTMCVPNGGGNGNSGGNNGDDDDTGDDPNTGNNPPIIIIVQGGWIGGPPNHNDNPGGNGGIALDDSGYLDLSQINDFEDWCVASEVNYFKASHENLPNAADILIHLRNYCDFEDCLDYKNGLRGFTSCEEMPECVKAILRSANMATLANEDDLVLSAEEYDAIFGNLCRGNFSSYKKTMLINYMKNVGGFGSSTESQLNSMDFKYAVRLYQYLNAGDFSPEIVDHAVAVVGWVADLDFYVDDDQFGWLLENMEEFEGIQILQDEAQFNSLELQRILQYPELFDEVHAFFSEHNYEGASENEVNLAAAVSKAYTEMYEEFEGSLLLELGDGPLRDIMLEMLWEVVKELVIDFIPGGTLATMGPELFDNLQEGQWMDAMFNAVDIALNEADAFFPQAKVASFALGAYVKSKHLRRAFKAFEKAKSLGEDFLIGLYNVFRNRLNWPVSKVRDKFQWLGGVNAKMDDASGSVFFEKLKEEFGTFTPQFLGINGNPVFKILELPYEPNHALYMELYPDANSGWNWTIEISKGARFATSYTQLVSKFKIRFDF